MKFPVNLRPKIYGDDRLRISEKGLENGRKKSGRRGNERRRRGGKETAERSEKERIAVATEDTQRWIKAAKDEEDEEERGRRRWKGAGFATEGKEDMVVGHYVRGGYTLQRGRRTKRFFRKDGTRAGIEEGQREGKEEVCVLYTTRMYNIAHVQVQLNSRICIHVCVHRARKKYREEGGQK